MAQNTCADVIRTCRFNFVLNLPTIYLIGETRNMQSRFPK